MDCLSISTRTRAYASFIKLFCFLNNKTVNRLSASIAENLRKIIHYHNYIQVYRPCQITSPCIMNNPEVENYFSLHYEQPGSGKFIIIQVVLHNYFHTKRPSNWFKIVLFKQVCILTYIPGLRNSFMWLNLSYDHSTVYKQV